MGVRVSASGGGNKPVDPGLYSAICYAVYDLGTQEANNPQFKDTRKLAMLFELSEERIEVDGKDLPRGMSMLATASLHQKANLRHLLESWRGREFTAEELDDFELGKLLGKPCQVQVMHKRKTNGETIAVISNILPPVKGAKAKKAENTLVDFALEAGAEIPADAPEWVVKMIQSSLEWRDGFGDESGKPEPPDDAATPEDDDLPF